MPAPTLQEWQPFFAIIGAAAATLMGAMFVVVSIGIGFLTPERAVATRTFLTSTVTHLATVLLGAALAMVPALGWLWFGAVIGAAGVAGLVYSVRNLIGFNQHSGTDFSDLIGYALAPVAAYALLLVAAAAALRAAAVGLDLFAVALGLLLVASLRNAWDMILHLVTRPRDSGG